MMAIRWIIAGGEDNVQNSNQGWRTVFNWCGTNGGLEAGAAADGCSVVVSRPTGGNNQWIIWRKYVAALMLEKCGK